MSSLPDVLQEEWRRRIANNVEAQRASDELKFHKTKVRKMREELIPATYQQSTFRL